MRCSTPMITPPIRQFLDVGVNAALLARSRRGRAARAVVPAANAFAGVMVGGWVEWCMCDVFLCY